MPKPAGSSNALKRLGIGRGDAAGLFLPLVPEAVIAFLACAQIGAIAVPIFSGFGAQAVAARLQDAQAKALDHGRHQLRVVASRSRWSRSPRKRPRPRPSLRHVIVARHSRTGEPVTRHDGHLDLARSGRERTRGVPVRAARSGKPPHDRLYFGHNGAAQGGRARARRFSGEDRAGGRATRSTCMRTIGFAGSPTWAGSWGPGSWSVGSPRAGRSSFSKVRPTIRRPTGCGRWSRGMA